MRKDNIEPTQVIRRSHVATTVDLAQTSDGAATAVFDDTHSYRYRLSRVWDETLPRVAWCMLNPSTATASVSDPTLARVVGFSHRWGAGGVEVVNLFALRTADPRDLRKDRDPVGPGNDEAIAAAAQLTGEVVVAWGNHGAIRNPGTGVARSVEVLELLSGLGVGLRCLRVTKQGQPGHPLYLRRDVGPGPWG